MLAPSVRPWPFPPALCPYACGVRPRSRADVRIRFWQLVAGLLAVGLFSAARFVGAQFDAVARYRMVLRPHLVDHEAVVETRSCSRCTAAYVLDRDSAAAPAVLERHRAALRAACGL